MAKVEYTVDVKELAACTVAYIRHVGGYQGLGEAFGRLMSWAGARSLLRFPETKMLAVYHDDPGITQEDKLRTSVCVTVPPGTAVDGDVGTMEIPGGRFAVAHFEIAADQFGQAWETFMRDWLPSSGYQPDDRMCYEVYLNDPKQHPKGKYIVDICEPVRPL